MGNVSEIMNGYIKFEENVANPSSQHCIYSGASGCIMMTSSKENIFRVTGPLSEEFTGQRWIPLIKASDTERLCLFWSAPE